MKSMEKKTQNPHMGISGWLSPQGELIPADYGNHAKIALDMEIKGEVKPVIDSGTGRLAHGERLLEILGYIKLVCRFSRGNVIESQIFLPQQLGYIDFITDAQREWLRTNCDKMTPQQESYIMQYL